ncbi:MAG: putative membrane metal-binding protein [Francisellaceae bacterium]|jgi:predicted membrane metal-binding protein
MKKMLKGYFTHSTIIGLWVLFFIMLYICLTTQLLKNYYFLLILPVIIAPFYEWYVHKYVLHKQLPEKNNLLRRSLIRLHHDHHRHPQNYDLLFAPVWAVVIHLIQTYLLFALITWSFSIALVPFTSGVFYYLWYEWVHLGHHTPEYDFLTPFGKKLKRAHMWHHHHNENYYWGITNYLGDKILGTFKDKSELEKSNTTKNIAGHTD